MYGILKRLSLRNWLLIVVAFGLIVLQVYLDLTMPEGMSDILQAIPHTDTGSGEIWMAGLKMLGYAAGSLAASMIVAVITSMVAATVAFDLRKSLYKKVNSFSLQEISHFSTSSLINIGGDFAFLTKLPTLRRNPKREVFNQPKRGWATPLLGDEEKMFAAYLKIGYTIHRLWPTFL